MISEIVKILDKPANNLIQRSILGLNVFTRNQVDYGIQNDPQLEFLRQICSRNQVSGNTGSLIDFADTPDELFGELSKYEENYYPVKIGCFGGEFYDPKERNSFPPLFFPKISSHFISMPDWVEDDASLTLRIMLSDALALFISPKSKDSEIEILNLLNLPLRSSNIFIQQAADFYNLVMVSEADRDYFTFFSQTTEALDLINNPLDNAIKLIKDSVWYKENQSALIWDDEYSMCLIQK